jgi:uncharacterized protein with PIN domain
MPASLIALKTIYSAEDESVQKYFWRTARTSVRARIGSGNSSNFASGPRFRRRLASAGPKRKRNGAWVTANGVSRFLEALLRYGKGRHPARLPLLFVGDDFSRTDLPSA